MASIYRSPHAYQIGADTVERLRSEIDSGQAGDKVDFGDPAAAPLGSDEEAAGTPPDRAAIARTRMQEIVRRPHARWTAGPILYVSFITVLIIIALLLALKYS